MIDYKDQTAIDRARDAEPSRPAPTASPYITVDGFMTPCRTTFAPTTDLHYGSPTKAWTSPPVRESLSHDHVHSGPIRAGRGVKPA